MFHDTCSYDSPTLFLLFYTLFVYIFFCWVNVLLLAILAAYRLQSHCCDNQKEGNLAKISHCLWRDILSIIFLPGHLWYEPIGYSTYDYFTLCMSNRNAPEETCIGIRYMYSYFSLKGPNLQSPIAPKPTPNQRATPELTVNSEVTYTFKLSASDNICSSLFPSFVCDPDRISVTWCPSDSYIGSKSFLLRPSPVPIPVPWRTESSA